MDSPARLYEDRAALQEQFATEGYIGPFKLADNVKLRTVLLERYFPQRFLTWFKAFHEKSIPVARVAAAPEITDRLQTLLGDDILLWGSIFIMQKPEQEHTWHLDVEYGRCDGATLWLGLKNLTSKTTVSLITRSHKVQTAPQELRDKLGTDLRDDHAVLAEAQKIDPDCELKTFTLKPGEFIIWAGRTWHATLNKSNKTRFSLILQYCTPDNIPRIPLNYDYPDTKWTAVQPPCLLVKGTDNFRRNKVVRKEYVESSHAWRRPFYVSLFTVNAMLGAVRQIVLRQLGR